MAEMFGGAPFAATADEKRNRKGGYGEGGYGEGPYGGEPPQRDGALIDANGDTFVLDQSPLAGETSLRVEGHAGIVDATRRDGGRQFAFVDVRTLATVEQIDIVRGVLLQIERKVRTANDLGEKGITDAERDELISVLRGTIAFFDPECPKVEGWLFSFAWARVEALIDAGAICIVAQHLDVVRKVVEAIKFTLAN